MIYDPKWQFTEAEKGAVNNCRHKMEDHRHKLGCMQWWGRVQQCALQEMTMTTTTTDQI